MKFNGTPLTFKNRQTSSLALNDFVELLSSIVSKKFDDECVLAAKPKSIFNIILTILVIVLVVINVVFGFVYIVLHIKIKRAKKKSKRKMRRDLQFPGLLNINDNQD